MWLDVPVEADDALIGGPSERISSVLSAAAGCEILWGSCAGAAWCMYVMTIPAGGLSGDRGWHVL